MTSPGSSVPQYQVKLETVMMPPAEHALPGDPFQYRKPPRQPLERQ